MRRRDERDKFTHQESQEKGQTTSRDSWFLLRTVSGLSVNFFFVVVTRFLERIQINSSLALSRLGESDALISFVFVQGMHFYFDFTFYAVVVVSGSLPVSGQWSCWRWRMNGVVVLKMNREEGERMSNKPLQTTNTLELYEDSFLTSRLTWRLTVDTFSFIHSLPVLMRESAPFNHPHIVLLLLMSNGRNE